MTHDDRGTVVVLRRTLGPAGGVNPLARVDVEWHGETPVAAIDGEVDASNIADVGRGAAQPGHEPVGASWSSTCRRRSTSTAPAST